MTAPRPAVLERRFDRSIVDGPLARAVWKLSWPSVLTNTIGGLQGMIDHALVGNLVGYTANAAIGVSWQIFLVVIVFLSSMFMGMSVLVSRYVGAGNGDMADRTVYQAFLAVMVLSFGVLAPLGYIFAPTLLSLVNASAAVQHEALPFLRIIFVFSGGMMIFFMVGGALRAAGDARTPMVLGITMTVLNVALNVMLIRGLGPIPAYGTRGAAIGTSIATGIIGIYSLWKLTRGGWVVSFAHRGGWGPDWPIIRALFRFGLPTGIQGIAMNIGGVFLLAFIGSLAQSAAAQAAFAVSYTELFSLVTWTSQGLLGAAAAIAGQNLGAGQPERSVQGVHVAARFGIIGAAFIGLLFWFIPRQLLALFGMHDPIVVGIGVELLRVLSVSGLFVSVALTYTGGLQGTGDTKSPLYISILSQVVIPLGTCFVVSRFGMLQPMTIWLAILAGHATRCGLSVARFNQGKWRSIVVV
ncbi:MAG TPA: MATE family efflux transporter [Gemmatimonadaceae bacterium]|nr:MATE family efflux transporter [Gemmatimonadaceae bacterium]